MNKKISSIFLFLLFVFTLSSCGPMYDTRYQFYPPDSYQGRACINQCLNSQSQCNELERYRNDDCEYRAKIDQQRCEDDVWRSKGRAPKWYECGSSSCSQDTDRCDRDYRSCYESCGGRVDAQTVCVANCDMVPPAPASATQPATGKSAPVYKEEYRDPNSRRY